MEGIEKHQSQISSKTAELIVLAEQSFEDA